MKQIFTVLIFTGLALGSASAQSVSSVQRKIARLEAQGHLVEAAQMHISLHDDGEREASIKAAMAMNKLGKYRESLFYFEHADSIGTLDHSDEVLGYFQALKAHQRYAEADELITTHLPKLKDPENIRIHSNQVRNYQKFLAYKNSRITTMPVNTPYSEFGPSISNGWLYFESTRIVSGNKEVHGANNQAYYNLYAHPIGAPNAPVIEPKGSWGKPQEYIAAGSYKTLSVPEEINKDHHDAPVFVTPKGKYLFFTTNWSHEGRKSYANPYLNLSYSANALENSQKIEIAKTHLNLYYSTNTNNVWSKPVKFPYGGEGWSSQHAFFDEKTNTLYFSSNMPGGQGGFDIWRSILKDGQWTAPENMGPMVNSARSEVFPVVSPEGYFIFASNGWPGLGGMDLFMVEDPALPPLNLLAGMNTEMDDFGMNFYDKGKGYFVSNRKESLGDDDIFEFDIDLANIIDYHRPTYKVVIVNAETGERIPVDVLVSGHGNDGKVIGGSLIPGGSAGAENTGGDSSGLQSAAATAGLSGAASGQILTNGQSGSGAGQTGSSGSSAAGTGSAGNPAGAVTSGAVAGGAGIAGSSSASGSGVTQGAANAGQSLLTGAAGVSGTATASSGTGNGGGAGSGDGTAAYRAVQLLNDQASFSFSADGFQDGAVTITSPFAVTGAAGAGSSREIIVRLAPKPAPVEKAVAQPLRVMTDGKMTDVKVKPVYFNFNRYDIRKESTLVLLKKLMTEHPQTNVILTGHTDVRGTTEYNEQLSRQRVENVREWLVSRGIPADRIQTRYLGESSPAVRCENIGTFDSSDKCLSEQQHQLNRRVEVELMVIR